MTSKSRFLVSALLWTVMLLAAYVVAAHAQTGASNDKHAAQRGSMQAAAATTVTGGGTAGQVVKWTSAATVGDSSISEDKYGKVGVGTTVPTSKLTVAGTIETTIGGVKFPDGTGQTTAFSVQSSPPLQPFAKELAASFPASGTSASAMFTVPAGKRLVIETVSLLIFLPSGQNFDSVSIATSVGGQTVNYSLFPSPIPQSGTVSLYGVTQPLKIYADAGTQVVAAILRPIASGDGTLNLVISGYLVDAQ